MGKTARKEAETEAPMLRVLGELVRRELHEFVIVTGVSALATMLEQERTEVCNPRYAHQSERRARRGGHAWVNW